MMWDEEITLLTPDGYDEDSLGQQIPKTKKNIVATIYPAFFTYFINNPPPCSNSGDRIFLKVMQKIRQYTSLRYLSQNSKMKM